MHVYLMSLRTQYRERSAISKEPITALAVLFLTMNQRMRRQFRYTTSPYAIGANPPPHKNLHAETSISGRHFSGSPNHPSGFSRYYFSLASPTHRALFSLL